MERLAHIFKWQEQNTEMLQRMKLEERRLQNKRMKGYIKRRKKRDPEFRLHLSLRSRLGSAMRAFGFRKSRSTLNLLGCTALELRRHLESLWEKGMCWENYGEWHIDHIKPCASFDLLDPEQQRQCFHFTNLQPLWASENLKKGSKYATGS